MITTKDTTIIGTSELRTKGKKALQNIGIKTIILTKRGKPIGVIQSYSQYQEEQQQEQLENEYFAKIAKKRMKNPNFISSEEMNNFLKQKK